MFPCVLFLGLDLDIFVMFGMHSTSGLYQQQQRAVVKIKGMFERLRVQILTDVNQ